MEVGGGSTSLTLLRRGAPNRSGVYALGSVRLRQQLDLRRHSHDVQLALLRRYIANIIEEIRLEIPLKRISHIIAIGGDVRFVAGQLLDEQKDGRPREIARDRFLAFCEEIERLDEDSLVERFRLPAVEAETLVPALLVYRTLVAETSARKIWCPTQRCGRGCSSTSPIPAADSASRTSSGKYWPARRRSGSGTDSIAPHAHHVAKLANRLFDDLKEEHGLGDRERLLLQVAALLHDVGVYVSLRAHHKHSQYILASSQIFGLSDEETAVVSNIARYHRRGLPQRSHMPYVALDREDRMIVRKLASVLRVANALDAEHAQKISDVRAVRHSSTWIVELQGSGDLTMERLAATARADMFAETFGRPLVIQVQGAAS